MKNLTTKGIILGHRNFGESDKLIFLYSEDLGKIKTIAKGSRKITSKFTGHLETLNLCNISLYFGPKNIIIQEIQTIRNFRSQKENLETLTSALQISEITNQLIYENQNIEELLPLLEISIHHINNSSKPDLIAISYIVKLLDKMGLIPDFKEVNTKLEEKYLKFLNFIKTRPLSEIENIKLTKEEKIIIQGVIQNIIERETQSKFHSLIIETSPF